MSNVRLRRQAFLLLLVFVASCNNKTCDCPINKEVVLENDSLIQEWTNNSESSLKDYWNMYDEPLLFENKNKSLRYHRLIWTRDVNKIYRIIKSNSEYKLIYKDYTESIDREDSLRIHKEITITDSIFNEIEGLIEASCFWTLPIVLNEKEFLDPVILSLEFYNPESNDCTNRKYHLVDVLSHEDEELWRIMNEIDEILVELCDED